MARKSLPPPPDDAGARPAPVSPTPLPAAPFAAYRREAGPLPPPPAMPAASVRAPIKRPDFRRWHLYALLGVIAALAAWIWLPGWWTEIFHGKPSSPVADIQSHVEQVNAEKTTESERSAQTLTATHGPSPSPASVESSGPPRTAARYQVPAGFAITPSTVSPDGRFGVLGPDFDHDSETARNQLIELATGRVLTTFEGGVWAEDVEPGSHRGHGHVSLNAAWSADGSSFLWELSGKWTPLAFVLVRVRDTDVEWQVDVYKAVLAEILRRTRDAVPRKYAVVRAQQGGGDSDSDGFMVDVSNYPGPRFSFPVRLDVTLTSNPKAMDNRPPDSNVDATMQATLAADGTITCVKFGVAEDAPPSNNPPPPPPPSATGTAQRLEAADRRLNVVYGQLRGRLDERGKAVLKADEMQFLKRLDPVPKTDPRRAEMIERRTDELLRWR